MIRDCPTTSSPQFRTQTTTPLCPITVRQLYSNAPSLLPLSVHHKSHYFLPTCQRQLPYRTLATLSFPFSVFRMSFRRFAFRISSFLIPMSSTFLVTCTKAILYLHLQFSPSLLCLILSVHSPSFSIISYIRIRAGIAQSV